MKVIKEFAEELKEILNKRIKNYRSQSIILKGVVIDKKKYREDYVLKRFAEEFEGFLENIDNLYKKYSKKGDNEKC